MTNITPEQFAKLLKTSTLNADEQRAVLNMLNTLSETQINELAEILKTDNTKQDQAMKQAQSKSEEILLKFGLQMKTIEKDSK